MPEEQVGTIIQEINTLSHRGPLPPAAEMLGYEQACPGAAERIIGMAEKEQKFRHEYDGNAQDAFINERRFGFSIGAFLFLVLILATIGGYSLGMAQWSLSFLGVGVLGFLAKYIPIHHSGKNSEKE